MIGGNLFDTLLCELGDDFFFRSPGGDLVVGGGTDTISCKGVESVDETGGAGKETDMTEADTLSQTDAAGLLKKSDAVANLAVHDLKRARHFYEETLGFEPVDREGDELIVYRSGDTVFNVYRSEYAGTNRATAMTWAVGDRIEAVVEALRAKGIEFEHYDMPGMRREGDLHIAGEMKVGWFKDPDGNILNVVTG